MKKKLLSFALVVALIFSMAPAILFVAPTEAYASTAHSQAEAVAWAKARANEGWCEDVDNAYGCQCVDLVVAYYDYLGVRRSSGNACDYASNSLPSGWSRVYSNPQPGDVIVWGPGAVLQDGGYKADPNFGHIGIVTGVVSSNQVSTVETNTYNNRPAKAFAARYSSTAACFIRPDFVATPAQASWDGPIAKDITETNAYLSGTVNFNQTVNTTQCGIRLYDSNGKCIAQKDESVNYNTSYVNIWYDLTGELGVTLTPGKTYTFKFYAISNGREYWSPTVKFTTAHTHNYKDGVCTVCGAKDPNYKPPVNPFVDVQAKDYFYQPVLWAVEHDITKGTDATHFSPDATCTRAQTVTFLWRAMGCPEVSGVKNPFVDVKPSDYYYKAVLWAVKSGVTQGIDAKHFGPNNTVTRAQTVTFMWRAAGSPAVSGVKNPFVDVKPSDYYCKAVLWAVKNDITNGTSATTFSPNAGCTRGQIVTFLFRY